MYICKICKLPIYVGTPKCILSIIKSPTYVISTKLNQNLVAMTNSEHGLITWAKN